MWVFDKIQINNFRSFGEDNQYEFENGKAVMIYGVHSSNKGANSNGSGKSSFLQSIEFALFGISTRALPKEEFIRNGEKQCSVTLWLSNVAMGNKMIIKRELFRAKSKPARVVVFVNGKENRELINEAVANEFIERQIGIKREDLLNYFLIGQNNNLPFFRSSDQKQKEIIGRFAQIDKVDAVLERLKAIGKGIEQDIQEVKLKIRGLESKVELIKSQIEEETNAEIDEGAASELREEIATLQQLKQEEQARIVDRQKISAQIKSQLEVARAAADNQDKGVLDLIEKNKKELGLKKELAEHLRLQLNGAISCPECGHSFVPGNAERGLDAITTDYELVVEEIAELERQKQALAAQSELLDRQKALVRQLRGQLAEADSELEETMDAMQSLDRRIERKQNELAKVLTVENPLIEKYKTQLAGFEGQLIDEKSKLEAFEDMSRDNNFWLFNFGNKGFKTFLINRVLNLIQIHINHYLAKICDLQLKLDGYKVLANGEVREKITVLVSRDGAQWELFEKYSGGQKNRMDICAVLALRRIINQNASDIAAGLNFLGLDETFDGLDTTGQKEIMDVLCDLGETCMVVSQINTAPFQNKLVIKYENFVSSL